MAHQRSIRLTESAVPVIEFAVCDAVEDEHGVAEEDGFGDTPGDEGGS
jgi:hypothetical protein